MVEATQTEIEAAVFRRLLEHLQAHTEVQNIELMVVADFCRNCLAKWYSAASESCGNPVSYAQAQEIVYGMPYAEWKSRFQTEATPEQLEAFEERLRRKQAQEQQQQ